MITRALVGLRDWVDARLPIVRAWNTHMGQYYAPVNFNFWYFFGVLSLFIMVMQILSGIWLAMNYSPTDKDAFGSVEYIMRDVKFGWILRYMHSTGASAFFIVIYLHIFRGLLYGSYKKPRELVWLVGMAIYVVLIGEGFTGYVLPWGQMSYWAAQVIISLFGAIPIVGQTLMEWVRGDYLISSITLNRLFAMHVVILPLLLMGLVVIHLLALHEVGSNNPDGIEIKESKGKDGHPVDGVPFHPYYTVHDLTGIAIFLMLFCGVLFFIPEMGGYFLEAANFEEANPLKTPEHIAPVWYFTAFYAILRVVTYPLFGVDAKFWGAILMAGAMAMPFFLPWLDRSKVKSWRYKGNLTRIALTVFAISFITLSVLGIIPVTPEHPLLFIGERKVLALIAMLGYFSFFILMPLYTTIEKTRPVPDRVTLQ